MLLLLFKRSGRKHTIIFMINILDHARQVCVISTTGVVITGYE